MGTATHMYLHSSRVYTQIQNQAASTDDRIYSGFDCTEARILGGLWSGWKKTGPRLRLVRKLAATAAATATATTVALARERRGLYMATDQNAGTHGWDWLPILTRRLSHCKGMPLVLHLDLQDRSFQHMGSKICQKMIVT